MLVGGVGERGGGEGGILFTTFSAKAKCVCCGSSTHAVLRECGG